jgi:hypothetical protein
MLDLLVCYEPLDLKILNSKPRRPAMSGGKTKRIFIEDTRWRGASGLKIPHHIHLEEYCLEPKNYNKEKNHVLTANRGPEVLTVFFLILIMNGN